MTTETAAMTDKYILDDNGEPVPTADLQAWAAMFGDPRRIVSKSHSGGVTVSTVFLGLDFSFGDGPPLLFETMIFGGPHDQYQERYTTRAEAIAGHTKAEQLAGVRT